MTYQAVRGWEKILKEETRHEFVSQLVDKFAAPLQGAQMNVLNI